MKRVMFARATRSREGVQIGLVTLARRSVDEKDQIRHDYTRLWDGGGSAYREELDLVNDGRITRDSLSGTCALGKFRRNNDDPLPANVHTKHAVRQADRSSRGQVDWDRLILELIEDRAVD